MATSTIFVSSLRASIMVLAMQSVDMEMKDINKNYFTYSCIIATYSSHMFLDYVK